MLGAEEFGFATAALVVLGCIMMRVCHLNTCPVGVATQDPELRKKFTGDPEYIVNFFRMIAEEVRELMAQLGFRTINEMVGRSDRLEARKAIEHWKAQGLDLTPILHQPEVPADVRSARVQMTRIMVWTRRSTIVLLELCERRARAQDTGRAAASDPQCQSRGRHDSRQRSHAALRRGGSAEDTIKIHFNGSAGQSFGAFVPRGISLTLEGDANDYVGKGTVRRKDHCLPAGRFDLRAEENIIIGNVALYGATSGEAFIRGMAGERFGVRNSGAIAVVEGVGDHGCEYMTGGRVVVLGRTGRNFAAGMCGGIAYVLDEEGDLAQRCNLQMVDLEKLEDVQEEEYVRSLIARHAELTNSGRAKQILDNWIHFREKLVKVMPLDYRRVLAEKKEQAAKTFAMVQHG